MLARELMVQPVITAQTETSLAEVARVMLSRRVGCVPVVNSEGKLCGIITETDFAAKERGIPFSMLTLPLLFSDSMPQEAVEQVKQEAATTAAKEIMITEMITASEDTHVDSVAKQMLRYDIDHVPIVRNGSPVGMISRHDLMRIVVGESKQM